MTEIRIIGQGGFGIVENIGGNIARKKLLLDENEEVNTHLRRRFKREVEYQKMCNHPNVVTVLDSDLESSEPWFTMPLAVCFLGQERNHNIPIDDNQKIIISKMLMNGLTHIHSIGQIHRDIKPQNILRFHSADNSTFIYAISDFGLVANRDVENTTTLTSVTTIMGTQAYMSPECYLDARNASFQSDIYSLGVVLKFIFDGEVGIPYSERTSSSLLNDIIRKCTKRNPNERYDSVTELILDFEQTISESEYN